MWLYGFANERPSIPSMTTWCERPMPSAKRPRADGLRRERLLRHRHRMARIRRHDGGAELDAARLAAADRRRHDRVHAEDVGEPAAREAVGLGALRLRDEVVDARGRACDVPDADADAHAGF